MSWGNRAIVREIAYLVGAESRAPASSALLHAFPFVIRRSLIFRGNLGFLPSLCSDLSVPQGEDKDFLHSDCLFGGDSSRKETVLCHGT